MAQLFAIQGSTSCRRAVVIVLAAAFLFCGGRPLAAKTPLELLKQTPKPQFRRGHTLLPLTRWGWTMPFDVRVELAEHWGYALEFGGQATPRGVLQLDDPESTASKICALAAADPAKYRLCVLLYRPFLDKQFRQELPEEAWCRDGEGNLVEAPRRRLSPEAPDKIFHDAAALGVEALEKIGSKAPIAMVLNGGEYGLGVFGFCGEAWGQDPKVLQAKGDRDWFDYVSEQKARQERITSDAVRRAVPDRLLYIYYHTSGCPHRGKYATWWQWAWDYRWMKPVSDIANSSIYYKQFNSGWTGGDDMLTQQLNAVGRNIALGEPLSYNWLCAGWTREELGDEAFSDMEHYMGYLKCCYTAGMIGGVAGYFSYPKGGFDQDLGDEMPSWLAQQVVLAHAHALFSHHEQMLRQGDLLPGPEKHRYSKDQPAYELPTGEQDLRVLARKHRNRDEWLITAWAAGGQHRAATVTIPGLGGVTLEARACGSVYRATIQDGRPSLELLDPNGMYPTAARSVPPAEMSAGAGTRARFSTGHSVRVAEFARIQPNLLCRSEFLRIQLHRQK